MKIPSILFDQNGLLGAGGLVLLTVTQLLSDSPALITAAGGFLMVVVSFYKTVHFVRRQNREGKQRADLFVKKMEILNAVQMGQMDLTTADFMLKNLD